MKSSVRIVLSLIAYVCATQTGLAQPAPTWAWTLPGLSAAARRVTHSSDGNLVLTGDGVSKLWRVSDGKLLMCFGSSSSNYAESFTPDGLSVVTIDTAGYTRVYDALTGARLRSFYTAGSSLLVTPDSQVVIVGQSGQSYFYDLNNGTSLGTPLIGNPRAVSADGLRLYTTDIDGTARIYDLATRALLGARQIHGGIITACEPARNGQFLVTAGDDGLLKLVDPLTLETIYQFPVFSRYIRRLSVSHDSLRLAVGTADPTWRIYDLNTKALISTFTELESVLDLEFHPSSGSLILGTLEHLWQVQSDNSRRRLSSFTSLCAGISATSNGDRVLALGERENTQLYDVVTDSMMGEVPEGDVDIAFSPSGQLFAYVDYYGSFADVRRVSDLSLVTRITIPGFSFPQRIAWGSSDEWIVVRHWPSGIGPRVSRYRVSDGSVVFHADVSLGRNIAVSPDGKYVSVARSLQGCSVLDALTGQVAQVINDGGADVVDVAFSPDSKTLAVANVNNVRLYDTTGWQLVGVVASNVMSPKCVTFSSDGKTIMTGGALQDAGMSGAAVLALFDVGSGSLLQSFRDGIGSVLEASFAKDDELIVLAASGVSGVMKNPLKVFAPPANADVVVGAVRGGNVSGLSVEGDGSYFTCATSNNVAPRSPWLDVRAEAIVPVSNYRSLEIRLRSWLLNVGIYDQVIQLWDVTRGRWSDVEVVRQPITATPTTYLLRCASDPDNFVGSDGKVKLRYQLFARGTGASLQTRHRADLLQFRFSR